MRLHFAALYISIGITLGLGLHVTVNVSGLDAERTSPVPQATPADSAFA
jgi:hypothetical protein